MTKPRLLIVEDGAEVAEMLSFFFSSHGYEVLVAHDGQTAIELCLSELPSLLLLDVGLPDIDGFTVCRRLRQTPRARNLPIIFATKLDRKADRMEGLSLGADDFISKPFDLEDLFLRVQNAISRSARNNLNDPRTGLPAMESVRQEIGLAAGQPDRQVVTFRLLHLEPFRDLYGSLATTDVLRATALLLNSTLDELGRAEDFLGQASDDTFVVICPADKADLITRSAVETFASTAHQHYALGSRDGDLIRAQDSAGNEHLLPALALEATKS